MSVEHIARRQPVVPIHDTSSRVAQLDMSSRQSDSETIRRPPIADCVLRGGHHASEIDPGLPSSHKRRWSVIPK